MSVQEAKKEFNGIEAHVYQLGESTFCDLTVYVRGQEYTGTLNRLTMFDGCLESARGVMYQVSQKTIDKIEKWAVENGY